MSYLYANASPSCQGCVHLECLHFPVTSHSSHNQLISDQSSIFVHYHHLGSECLAGSI